MLAGLGLKNFLKISVCVHLCECVFVFACACGLMCMRAFGVSMG